MQYVYHALSRYVANLIYCMCPAVYYCRCLTRAMGRRSQRTEGVRYGEVYTPSTLAMKSYLVVFVTIIDSIPSRALCHPKGGGRYRIWWAIGAVKLVVCQARWSLHPHVTSQWTIRYKSQNQSNCLWPSMNLTVNSIHRSLDRMWSGPVSKQVKDIWFAS